MSRILDDVKKLIKEINYEGYEINGTKEINNVSLVFKRSDMNLLVEENEIAEYYNTNVENYYARLKLEKNHYAFLEAFLVHKIGEVLYFHKQENLTSRKFVIWSQDCISAIQFIARPNRNLLNVFIRSSDAIRLLPIDLLYMVKLLDRVTDEFNITRHEEDAINFFITSSHFYLKDQAIAESIR
jgi:hypothetical protein